MLAKLFDFTFQRIRPEFYYSAYVVISALVYSFVYILLDISFLILDWGYSIDWEIIGVFIGCIGFGELVRTFSKLYLPNSLKDSEMLTSFCAGAATISSLWALAALELGHPAWTVLVSMPLGGLFYWILIYAHKFDQKCWSKL